MLGIILSALLMLTITNSTFAEPTHEQQLYEQTVVPDDFNMETADPANAFPRTDVGEQYAGFDLTTMAVASVCAFGVFRFIYTFHIVNHYNEKLQNYIVHYPMIARDMASMQPNETLSEAQLLVCKAKVEDLKQQRIAYSGKIFLAFGKWKERDFVPCPFTSFAIDEYWELDPYGHEAPVDWPDPLI